MKSVRSCDRTCTITSYFAIGELDTIVIRTRLLTTLQVFDMSLVFVTRGDELLRMVRAGEAASRMEALQRLAEQARASTYHGAFTVVCCGRRDPDARDYLTWIDLF